MSIYWRIMAYGLTWWAALLGVLQLTHLRGNWGHAICGPWGCGPPLQSLAACHGFWFVLATPLVAIPIRCWPPRRLQLLGSALLVIGGAGLLGVAVWQAVVWLPDVRAGEPSYFVQRYLFTLATWVDLPIVPVTLAGALCWSIGSRRRSRTRSLEDAEATTEPRLRDTMSTDSLGSR